MIRIAISAMSLTVLILLIVDIMAIAFIITVDQPKLIGLNCSTGMIAFRDEEDEFGRCSIIERINR